MKLFQIADPAQVFWFFRLVPFVCLATSGLCASIDIIKYPAHFDQHCAQFGEFYKASYTDFPADLIYVNAAWLISAVPLVFLGRRRFVSVFYTIVSSFFLYIIWTVVSQDFSGVVNCYRDIGLGKFMTFVFLVAQAFILLVFLVIVSFARLIRFHLTSRRADASSDQL